MSKGLGDTIEKITSATGIKKVVDVISEALDIDCGCSKRKDFLNKLVPYREPKTENKKPLPFKVIYHDSSKSSGE